MFKIERLIALDIGDVWTGVAHSDPAGIFAIMHATWKSEHIIEELLKYQETTLIKTLVIGIPINMKGKETQQTQKVITFVQKIEDHFPNLIIQKVDERLSSVFAQNIMKQTSKKIDKTKEHQKAAALMLENYLNRYIK